MKTPMQTCLAIVVACCAAMSFPVKADETTTAIESKIQATGLKYSKTESGDFRFLFDEGDGRSQLVIVNGSATSYHDAQFVEIWSKSVASEMRPVNTNQMRELLATTDGGVIGGGELGHWCLIKPSESGKKWHLYYSIHIPITGSPDAFEAAIRECSTKADGKEKELVGTDEN
ncbi:MAG: hypothetical protein IJ678_02780 [Kiritimatiellae bacterium]|nr:hypothetical protein [Kiritimatiellia bacterium]